jgi:hypothetical protein
MRVANVQVKEIIDFIVNRAHRGDTIYQGVQSPKSAAQLQLLGLSYICDADPFLSEYLRSARSRIDSL